MESRRAQRRIRIASVGAGLFYGVFLRLAFGLKALKPALEIMSIAFIFFVPFAIGFIAVYVGEQQERHTWWQRMYRPLVPVLLALVATLVLAWEGLICIWFWLPLVTVLAMLGGLVAGMVRLIFKRSRPQQGTLAAVALLPFLVSPLEQTVPLPLQERRVETRIDIEAKPEVVWKSIIRVAPIVEREHRFSWAQAIGFPRPIEATLSRESVGGVRHATFQGNVLFVETITDWEDRRKLAFSIAADPSGIPSTTLDEHVTVGGPYFDVLRGEYQLEVLGPRRVRLHLASVHRLSTRFNAYSGLWTDFIMRDIQNYILAVLKDRCEGKSLALGV